MVLFRATTDRLFLRFCRTGDAHALGEVFDRTAPELLRVACYLCGNRSDAEDLVQRTFLAAIESRGSYDPGRRAVPWLLGILANHGKRLQRERRRPLPPADEPTIDPALAAAQAELTERLAQLQRELGEPYGEVLRLHLEQGLNGKEIAARLGRPAGTVRTQLVRALERLRERLPAGFVGGLVPWLPAGRATTAALEPMRTAVLQAARHAATPSAAASAAAGAAAAASAFAGGFLMSKKFLSVVPVLATALGFLGYVAWPEPPTPPSTRPLADAAPASGELDRLAAQPVPDAAAPPLRTAAVDAAAAATDPGFAAVRVRVRWHDDGSPAASVGVFASCGSTVQRRDAVTGDDGTCLLPHLLPGDWQITSSLSDAPQRLTLAADEVRSAELTALRGAVARGRVVDDMDRPVAGARIWMSLVGDPSHGHETTESDADGRFELAMNGTRYLGARAEGFTPSHTVVVDFGRPDSLQPTLRLRHQGGTVQGTVRDARGAPIAWAKVLVGEEHSRLLNSVTAPTRENLPRGVEVVTDAAGRYEATGVPAGLCEVRAWATGFAPYTGEIEVPARGRAELPIQLVPGALVKGCVRDESGAPIAGASVAWGRDFLFAHGTTRTDAQGTFALADLPIGWLDLRAELAGAATTTRVELAAGTTATWDPVLGSSRPIAGRVVGPRGEGLTGFRVAAVLRDTEKAAVDTDAEGRFVLAEVGSEVVGLEVSLTFQTLKLVPGVKPGTQNVLVQLSAAELPTASVRGRLVSADGRPVAATIVPWRKGSDRALHYQSDPATGVFRVGPVPPGSYTLSVESPSHGRQPGGAFELRPDEQRDLGDLVLVAPGKAQLQVTIDGKPAPGGLVFFQLADGSWSDTVMIENGLATAPALRPGRHFVHVDFQGLHGACDLVVESAATAHASLDLQRTTRCEVVLDLPRRSKQGQLQATLHAWRADGTFAGVFGIVGLDGPPTFFVDLPLGRYRFDIRTADGRTATVPEQELTSLTQTVQRKVALEPAPR